MKANLVVHPIKHTDGKWHVKVILDVPQDKVRHQYIHEKAWDTEDQADDHAKEVLLQTDQIVRKTFKVETVLN